MICFLQHLLYWLLHFLFLLSIVHYLVDVRWGLIECALLFKQTFPERLCFCDKFVIEIAFTHFIIQLFRCFFVIFHHTIFNVYCAVSFYCLACLRLPAGVHVISTVASETLRERLGPAFLARRS